MTLISKKIIYLSGDTSDVDQGFSRNKHTISYHVQSSLNFELDLKISWCHGLITRYLVPKKWWRTFPEYHKIWYWEKSFEINENVKLVLRYISVQQRFFKNMFSDSTESISQCLGKFDLWPLNLLQQSIWVLCIK